MSFFQILGLRWPLRRDVRSHYLTHGADTACPAMTLPRVRHHRSAVTRPSSQRWGVTGALDTMACHARVPLP